MIPPPPRSTLFPYTTLFRSALQLEIDFLEKHPNNMNSHINLALFYDELNQKRSEEHTSELQSRGHLVCRLLLEKKKRKKYKCSLQSYSLYKNKDRIRKDHYN